MDSIGQSFDARNIHERKARQWMDDHPEAMRLFTSLAIHASRAGLRKIGIKAIAERVRWEFVIERDDYDFKINNNHVAYIARELIMRFPVLAGSIELRGVKA